MKPDATQLEGLFQNNTAKDISGFRLISIVHFLLLSNLSL